MKTNKNVASLPRRSYQEPVPKVLRDNNPSQQVRIGTGGILEPHVRG